MKNRRLGAGFFISAIYPSPDIAVTLFSLHRSIAPSLHRSIAPSLHRSIAPSLHRSIAPSLHRSIAPSLHRSIVPSFHRSPRYSKLPFACILVVSK
ncbi:hypothetical protein D6R50_00315 [Aeromonas veronii]|uniref:Uncharacterized protein n=1 Tax=Aeromonas veronii TaxID=654 RepID=A0A3A9IM78_AERVE|nr:hypothetical protein D6R50_00315 [Aeromonas veronii]